MTPFPGAPARIWIRPDDYHVPYAGTAGDGRRFFASQELFDLGSGSIRAFVGVFLWTADGEFSELRVDDAAAEPGRPPGNSRADAGGGILERRLAELGEFVLEPIEVAPFVASHEGIEFGFVPQEFDGSVSVNLMPGDSMAYYEPWDGFEYDT